MKLKHYKTYMYRLKRYIQASGLRLILEDGAEDAFVAYHGRITIDTSLPQHEKIATLLHEIGHSIDALTLTKAQADALDKKYYIAYTKKSHPEVIECEKRAWKYGRALAKRLGINLGRWYDTVEKECLNDYKEDR